MAKDKSAASADSELADAPTADAPTADAPTADAPTADAPTADAPTVDAPTADAPTADAPTADTEAFVLRDCGFGKASAVILLSAADAVVGEANGMLDLHPDAIKAAKAQ